MLGEEGWGEVEPLVIRRNLFTMTSIMDMIIVTGGSKEGDRDFSSVEVFEDRVWHIDPALELTSARYGHCAVEYRNKLIIMGGISLRNVINLVEILDLHETAAGWSTLTSMIVARAYSACGVVEYGGITGVMVTGGWNVVEFLDSVEFLNLEDYQGWEVVPSLLSARSKHTMATVGGLTLVVGGFSGIMTLLYIL